jgi:hypothetical protein
MRHIILAALLLSTASAHAEPTDAKLAQLVGKWEGIHKFTVAGKTSDWKVSLSCERAAIGPPVICTLAGAAGDQTLEEVWLLARDVKADAYHLFMTNSWGEAFDHSATWADAAKVSFVHASKRDGKALREEYALSFKPDEMTMRGKLTIAGKVIGDGNGTLKRVK